jgi:hypothetical protein
MNKVKTCLQVNFYPLSMLYDKVFFIFIINKKLEDKIN